MSDPYWENDVDISLIDADNLQKLTDLRVDDVILWALVMGIRTSRSIASRVGWPHEWVMVKLREYKGDHRVFDLEGLKSMEWYFREEETLINLQSWVNSQRQPGGIFNPHEEKPE